MYDLITPLSAFRSKNSLEVVMRRVGLSPRATSMKPQALQEKKQFVGRRKCPVPVCYSTLLEPRTNTHNLTPNPVIIPLGEKGHESLQGWRVDILFTFSSALPGAVSCYHKSCLFPNMKQTLLSIHYITLLCMLLFIVLWFLK